MVKAKTGDEVTLSFHSVQLIYNFSATDNRRSGREERKSFYSFLRVAKRHSLGRF